jgi:hypothetical protein
MSRIGGACCTYVCTPPYCSKIKGPLTKPVLGGQRVREPVAGSDALGHGHTWAGRRPSELTAWRRPSIWRSEEFGFRCVEGENDLADVVA